MLPGRAYLALEKKVFYRHHFQIPTFCLPLPFRLYEYLRPNCATIRFNDRFGGLEFIWYDCRQEWFITKWLSGSDDTLKRIP